MPKENSAGAIIFRVENGQPLYLLLHYHSGHWDFSRGHIEKGESVEQTVRREVQEETGIQDLQIVPGFTSHTKFFFKRVHNLKGEAKKKAPWIIKLITLCVAETKTEHIVISSEQKGFGWFAYKEAVKKMAPHAKKIFPKAHEFILSAKGL